MEVIIQICNLCEHFVCVQLLLSCLHLCVDLTCNTAILLQVKHILLLHLNSKFHAMPFQIPSLLTLPSYTLIRTVDPSTSGVLCQKSRPVQPFPSHSLFFPLWTLPAGSASVFIVSLKKVRSHWSLYFLATSWQKFQASNIFQGKPRWCNIICLQRAALQSYYKADSPAQTQRNVHMHTYIHALTPSAFMVAIGVQQHCDGHSNIFGATSDQHILSHCLNTCTNTFFRGKYF